jgi:tetratricopeptide (TPR) repeat protein
VKNYPVFHRNTIPQKGEPPAEVSRICILPAKPYICLLANTRMKRISGLILLIVPLAVFPQSGSDALLAALTRIIDSAQIYDAQKVQRIQNIQSSFAAAKDTAASAQYDYYLDLYEEYKIYKFDTAFLYAKRLEAIAQLMNDPVRTAESKTKLAFILLSAGMYKEAEEVLQQIPIANQPDSVKAAYFLTRGRFYYDLSDYTGDDFFYPGYFQQAGQYLDSALRIFPRASFEHSYYSGLKQIKTGDMDGAYKNLQSLLKRSDLSHHQVALAASTLSFVYFTRNQTDSAISYQAMAAMADIRSSTKETFAVLNLSQVLFSQGNFELASRFIKKAVDDAGFYGARQRKIQLGSILPIIQASEIAAVKKQRQLWTVYGIIASLLLLLFAFLLVTIRRQNQKLRLAQQQISAAHEKLQLANTSLMELNARLEESNRIKEEYVGYFFTLDAEVFRKMERLKKAIEEKIHYNKFNEIKFLLNNINIADEREELVQNFDRAFLKLFPNFVNEFNELFDEENRVHLQEGELLNTDLRIYALLRLGIKENEKIAEILQYSVKSIYAYKTRLRNKSKVPKDEFDKMVMEIRSVSR